MSSPESKTCPSVVTTARGIGGAWRNISVPTQPSTPNEHTKIATKTIQSFFIMSHSSELIFRTGRLCTKVGDIAFLCATSAFSASLRLTNSAITHRRDAENAEVAQRNQYFALLVQSRASSVPSVSLTTQTQRTQRWRREDRTCYLNRCFNQLINPPRHPHPPP